MWLESHTHTHTRTHTHTHTHTHTQQTNLFRNVLNIKSLARVSML